MEYKEVVSHIKRYRETLDTIMPDESANPHLLAFEALELSVETKQTDEIDLSEAESVLDNMGTLIKTLELAKEASHYAQSHFKATNQPRDMHANVELERSRKRINETDLVKTFKTFKAQRESLDSKSPGYDIKTFEAKAYAKGKGMNIRSWAHHALTERSKKKSMEAIEGVKVLGNCTEQSNLAFAYLYSKFNEVYCEHKEGDEEVEGVRLFDKVERIDIQNSRGGHVLLLLNRKPDSDVFSDKRCSTHDLLSKASELGDECVVVDPWNADSPIYLASDIATYIPPCGQVGRVNIEFGLDLSEQPEPPEPTLP